MAYVIQRIEKWGKVVKAYLNIQRRHADRNHCLGEAICYGLLVILRLPASIRNIQ